MDSRSREMTELQKLRSYFEPRRTEYDTVRQKTNRVNYLSGLKHKGLLIAGIVLAWIAALWFDGASKDPGCLAGAIFFGIPGGILIYLYARKKRSERNEIAALQAELRERWDDLAQYHAEYGPCSLGVEYTDPAVLDILYDLMRSGRADSMKEAVNLWLDDCHKEEMQATMNATAEAASDAAHSARTAAFMSTLNLLRRL